MSHAYGAWPVGKSQVPASSTNNNSVLSEGRPVIRNDVDTSGNRRSGNMVKGFVVRNASGVAILPSMLVRWKSGYIGQQVDGYTRTTSALPAGIADDQLPTAGAANNDLFVIVTEGPVLAKTSPAADATNVIAVFDTLYALTAAASTHSTTAGRVYTLDGTFTATETTDGTAARYSRNGVGFAMSAKTTANTNATVLIYATLPMKA